MSSLGSHPEFHLNGMVLSSEPGMWGIHVPWHVEHEYQKKVEENEKIQRDAPEEESAHTLASEFRQAWEMDPAEVFA